MTNTLFIALGKPMQTLIAVPVGDINQSCPYVLIMQGQTGSETINSIHESKFFKWNDKNALPDSIKDVPGYKRLFEDRVICFYTEIYQERSEDV